MPDVDWRTDLVPVVSARGYVRRGRVDLADLPAGAPIRGSLHLYSRQNLDPNRIDDWSVGLVYSDYADQKYPVIRCNGPHLQTHKNYLEGTSFRGQSHVHQLTHRYLTHGKYKPDCYAEIDTNLTSILRGIEALVVLVNLKPAVGALFT